MRFEPYATSSVGNRIYRWLGSLHTGNVGGLPVQLLLFAGILGVPVLAYTGIRSYLRRKFIAREDVRGLQARVKTISSETSEIKVFELYSANRVPLPAFTPGAHIDVWIDEHLVRQYSLCNGSDEKNRYVIAVKREPDSRGEPVPVAPCATRLMRRSQAVWSGATLRKVLPAAGRQRLALAVAVNQENAVLLVGDDFANAANRDFADSKRDLRLSRRSEQQFVIFPAVQGDVQRAGMVREIRRPHAARN